MAVYRHDNNTFRAARTICGDGLVQAYFSRIGRTLKEARMEAEGFDAELEKRQKAARALWKREAKPHPWKDRNPTAVRGLYFAFTNKGSLQAYLCHHRPAGSPTITQAWNLATHGLERAWRQGVDAWCKDRGIRNKQPYYDRSPTIEDLRCRLRAYNRRTGRRQRFRDEWIYGNAAWEKH